MVRPLNLPNFMVSSPDRHAVELAAAVEDAEKLEEAERNRWAEQHQAKRSAERDRCRRRRALQDEVRRLEEQIEHLE